MAYKAGKARESIGKASKGMGKGCGENAGFPKGGNYSAKWPLGKGGMGTGRPKLDISKKK